MLHAPLNARISRWAVTCVIATVLALIALAAGPSAPATMANLAAAPALAQQTERTTAVLGTTAADPLESSTSCSSAVSSSAFGGVSSPATSAQRCGEPGCAATPADPLQQTLQRTIADPLTGLSAKPRYGPDAGDCGAFSWTVQWELDKESPKGGWVVQKVELTRNVTDCITGKDAPGGLDPKFYPLWESWQINKDRKVTTYAGGKLLYDDTYSQGSLPGTKGTVTITGTAEFYEDLTLPADFKVTNGSPAGILPTTMKDPGKLAGGTGAIAHNLTATWDGCGADKKTKLTNLSPK